MAAILGMFLSVLNTTTIDTNKMAAIVMGLNSELPLVQLNIHRKLEGKYASAIQCTLVCLFVCFLYLIIN